MCPVGTQVSNEYRRVGDASYFVVERGSGPPVLLLHGFPETHRCWDRVVPRLAETYRVVTPDLRGYGASQAPPGGPDGEGYSKREMAAELVELMAGMGHERFVVVGHDRGARVAYRMALDHPGVTIQVALLNVLPTVVQFELMGGGPSLAYWPWFFLAQPAPFPERLVSADPDALLEHVFATWAGNPDAISADCRAAYRAAMTAETITAMCADYRASLYLDRQRDFDDRQAGHRITVPVLLVTGEEETQLGDASDIWRGWTLDLRAVRVPGGHFIPEEAPEELTDVLLRFLEPTTNKDHPTEVRAILSSCQW
jgi:haloacetate dehalogenase